MRILTYLVATTLDGFIADLDGGYDAFAVTGDHIDMLIREHPDTLPGAALDALGITAPTSGFDTVVMGWSTYATGLPTVVDPYPHLRQYVFSRSRTAADVPGGVTVTADPPAEVVRSLKAESSPSGIWLCGGGQLASALLPEIDRLVLKVNPVVLGAGIPLFADRLDEPLPFTLTSSRPFASGVVVSTYDRAG